MTNRQVLLDAMTVFVDKREHETELKKERLNKIKKIGPKIKEESMDFGDYSFKISLPWGQEIDFRDKVRVERKSGLAELSSNFTDGRERFEKEFNKAKEAKVRMYLLIEDASLEDIIIGNYSTKLAPYAFTASFFTWCARYNVTPIFCPDKWTAYILTEIFLREAQEGIRHDK